MRSIQPNGSNQTRDRYSAHNLIRDVILQCCDLGHCKTKGDKIPPLHPNQPKGPRGDLLVIFPHGFRRSGGTRPASTYWDEIIGDVSLVHPRHGNTDDAALWGSWNHPAFSQRITTKVNKYAAYNQENRTFIPMVTSTYLDMCDDLLRFLWLLAERQTSYTTQGELLGENPLEVTKLLVKRMYSRVACAIAIGTARRIQGTPSHGLPHGEDGFPTHPAGPIRDRSPDEPLLPV